MRLATRIDQTRLSTVVDLWSEVEPRVVAAECLEEAAQALAAGICEQFDDSVVMARVFITVPFISLPEPNRQFVRGMVEVAQAADDLKQTTPVLSLIGTCGKQEGWCDRRRSKGHIGIPLISCAFVRDVPMISRLLKELGVPVDWVDSHDSEMVVDTIGSATGLFFVEDAATATDSQGRKIITAQDFVSRYDVKSVFGMGGAYSTGQIAVIVVFCRNQITRSVAERFLSLAAFFIGKTTEQVELGRIFRD